MKIRAGFVAAAAMALAACGGGGGGDGSPIPQPPIPVHTATPTPVYKASGKPMAFHNTQDNQSTQSAARAAAARILAVHTMDATPTPSASPTASPSPTPTPIPTPTGLPLIPTRMGFAVSDGFSNGGTGTNALVEVMSDATLTTPVQEATTPQVWTSDSNNIGICVDPMTKLPCVYPLSQVSPGYTAANPQWADAWEITMSINMQGVPEHEQMAVVFPDSTGVVDIYRYDAMALTCAQPAAQFVNGTAVPATSGTDVGLNCANSNVSISGGYQDLGAAQPDAFGSYIQDLHDISSVGTFNPSGTTLSATDAANLLDHVLIVKDGAGNFHKVMIFYVGSDANGNLTEFDAADLQANPDGTFAF